MPSFGSKPAVSSVSGAKRNSQTTRVRSDLERDDPRRHDEVRLDGQEHRREDRVVVDALPLLLRELPERRPAHPAARRHAAALLVDDHVPAEDAAVPEVVGAAPVVREPGEGRMHGGAVVALREVLEEELPVGGDVVLDAPRRFQSREAPRSEAAQERLQRLARVADRARAPGSGTGTLPTRTAPLRAAGSPPCRTTARRPCAARPAVSRRGRRSRRGTGIGGRPPGARTASRRGACRGDGRR